MLKKIYITFALLLFAFSLFVGIDRFVHHLPNCFCLEKIVSSHPYSPEWDIPLLSEEEQACLDHILDQKFTYYSKGSQAYVFISEDKQYILKLLKQPKLKAKSWLSYFPLSFNPYYQERLFKKQKAFSTFNACKIAFTELKKETGLIYLHLNRNRHLQKNITLFDRQGKQHSIDINKTNFYVQKKAELIYSRISELMHIKDVETAKKIISSVFSLIDFLGKKGIVDNDPILRKNFGLIDDVAIQIDIGKMRIDPLRGKTLAYKSEIRSITDSFGKWIKNNYPELVNHFQNELEYWSLN